MYSLSVEEEELVDDDAAENMKEDEEGRGWGGERKALSDDATDDNAIVERHNTTLTPDFIRVAKTFPRITELLADEYKPPSIHRQRRKDDVRRDAPAAAMDYFAAVSSVVPEPIDMY
jgi:hypothetical protein